jgi:hypothetical protein
MRKKQIRAATPKKAFCFGKFWEKNPPKSRGF